VLAHLRDADGPQSVEQVAGILGLRPNTARYHLDALCREGLAVREPEAPSRRGRPRILYAAAPPEPPAAGGLSLPDELADQLAALPDDACGAAEAAGIAWGVSLAARHPECTGLSRVVSTLEELGHEPVLVGEPPTMIELRSCPFLDTVLTDGDAVCRLHLGLMRGLAADDDEYAIAKLRRNSSNLSCAVWLERRAAPGGPVGVQLPASRGPMSPASRIDAADGFGRH
jgi:predicted ArsR family transcriptional regulator